MSAFLLLPKYEQAMRRIQELENECIALRDFQVKANDQIANLTKYNASHDMKPRPEIRVIGTKRGSNLHYTLCVDQIEHMENGILVRVFL